MEDKMLTIEIPLERYDALCRASLQVDIISNKVYRGVYSTIDRQELADILGLDIGKK